LIENMSLQVERHTGQDLIGVRKIESRLAPHLQLKHMLASIHHLNKGLWINVVKHISCTANLRDILSRDIYRHNDRASVNEHRRLRLIINPCDAYSRSGECLGPCSVYVAERVPLVAQTPNDHVAVCR
jgi:hypothetical protein